MIRAIWIGESWQGSCARTLREALSDQSDVIVGEVPEDHYLPRHRGLPLRVANRVLRPFQLRELERVVLQNLDEFRPDVVIVYKGSSIRPDLIKAVQSVGIPLVNVFPDLSPHAHGRQLEVSLGLYNLVISTKPFHPVLWTTVYGYSNSCVFVPQGYDPKVHLCDVPAEMHEYDVVLCCTWRPEYHRLMCNFAKALGQEKVTVAVAGAGWSSQRQALPQQWRVFGPRTGRAYTEFLRSGKLAIAPVSREAPVQGMPQPGDEDSTRTYELAAVYCTFLHQRTEYVEKIYDEQSEVPLWNSAEDLAALVRRWLRDDAGRKTIAAKAHARAVPAYSMIERAKSIVRHLRELVNEVRTSKARK